MKWVWPQLLSLIVVALGDWIDSDTPADRQVTRSLVDGTEYKLVSGLGDYKTAHLNFRL